MPSYNGYFLNVALQNGNESHVRDYDLNEQLSTKGAILTASADAGADGLAKLVKVAAGSTNQVLAMNASGMPEWTNASAAAGVNDADLNIKLNDASATKLFSANSNTATTLSFASGSANGSIAVNGTNVSVTGLKSAAFAETTAFDPSGAAATAEQNAKAYTDGKISDLGADLMNFAGAGATLPAAGSSAKGDVYVINSGDNAGKEYIFDGTNWVELGTVTEADLNNYVAKEDVVPSVTSGVALATVGGKTIYAPAAAAQQQADWAETTTTSVTFIKNKPDLSIYAEAADLNNYVTKDSVVPGVTSGISLGTVGGTTIYMPSAASLSSTLGLKALAFKDNVSVPASTFVTDITATANNQAVIGVGATGASKISAFNGGAAAFTVTDGVLSLDYTAATLTYGNATTSTLTTINVNNYSATKNSAMTLG